MADRDVLINENTMIAIANAIRNKSNSQTAYTPAQMPAAINQISGGSGGGSAITVTDTVDSHGGIIKTINAVDISDTTATAGDVASGKVFYTADGTQTTGTASGGITVNDIATGTAPVGDITITETSLINCAFSRFSRIGKATVTNATTLPQELFSNSSITEALLNNVVNFTGGYVFQNCTSLTRLYAPNFVGLNNNTENYSFSGCTALTSIDLPEAKYLTKALFWNTNSVASINCPKAERIFGDQTFRACGKNVALGFVSFPSLTDLVGTNAFADCPTLTGIDLGNTYRISGNSVFSGNTNMATLVLRYQSVVQLGNINTFNNTPFANGGAGGEIYVPSALISDYQVASNWSTIHGYGTIT